MRQPLTVADLRQCSARNILIIKPSALGDVVQSLPVLGPLRAHFPDARITWVIRDDLRELVDGHPLLDTCLLYKRTGGLRECGTLLRTLRREHFDLVIDLQGLLRSAVMTAVTRAPLCVGLENSREGSHHTHNLVLPQTDRLAPAHARYWQVAEALGRGGDPQLARLPISAAAQEWARDITADRAHPLLAVHAGAMWETKRWPVKSFAVVAARAARDLGASLLLVGGKSEQATSSHMLSLLRDLSPQSDVRDLTGRTGIGQLAAVLERADLLLTGDSGPMHLAAAVGTPVVGLFTSTDPVISGPREVMHTLLSTPSPCGGCYHRRCPLTGSDFQRCQRELSVCDVWPAVASAIGELRSPA